MLVVLYDKYNSHLVWVPLLNPSRTELSSEWSCQYVSITLNFWSNFGVPPLVTEVTISPTLYFHPAIWTTLSSWKETGFDTGGILFDKVVALHQE
jgi:hypothetical protein